MSSRNRNLDKLFKKEMTRKEFLGWSAFALASVFGIVGIIEELKSHAATPFLASEPEAGTVTAPASVVTDSTASGGQAVQFAAASTSGGTGEGGITGFGHGKTLSSIYAPNGASSIKSFAAWRGRALDCAVTYLNHGSASAMFTSGGSSMADPSFTVGQFDGLGLSRIILGVPLIADDKSATIATGATGAYNSHFAALGTWLVAHGHSNTIIRLGWESNLNNVAQANAANFRSYWRQAVKALRVPGNNFLIDLCASNGSGKWGDSYPGDDVVDIIGIDIYDWDYSTTPGKTSGADRWTYTMNNQNGGVAYWTAFAAKTTGNAAVPTGGSKPIGVGEWAITGTSGGFGSAAGNDDPDWITAFAAWVKANNVLYESYFNNNGDGFLSNGQWPNSEARYKSLFGAGSTI